MLQIRRKKWEKAFENNPKRYLQVLDELTKEVIEVHDTETGNVWFLVDRENDRWMWIN